MNVLLELAGSTALAASLGVPALDQTVVVPGQSTTAMTPNKQGFSPDRSGYVYTHPTRN